MTDASLSALFATHGNVERAKIVNDRDTGKSRGFGFVTMTDEAAGQKAVQAAISQLHAGRYGEAHRLATAAYYVDRRLAPYGHEAMTLMEGVFSLAFARRLLDAGAVHGGRSGRDHLRVAARTNGIPLGRVDAVIESKGLKQMSDTGELERILDEVLAANAKSVEEFRAGKEKAFNALIGQAMKATKGKSNPATVNELLKKKLG